jgi:hypothetical protein
VRRLKIHFSLEEDYQFDKLRVRNITRHETRDCGMRGKLSFVTQCEEGGVKIFCVIK